MKYNLKNRPKSCCGTIDYLPKEAECQVWFEGFEKGLRKHLQAFIDEHAWPECSEFSVKETVKEILGE